MTRQTYLLPRSAFPRKQALPAFPWSKIILSFLMISSFLIFATTGTNETETLFIWSGHISDIIIGTGLFSLATTLLIWARRLVPKNI